MGLASQDLRGDVSHDRYIRFISEEKYFSAVIAASLTFRCGRTCPEIGI
jgi:hypothetical protein